jgi:replicative DNA helicase
MKQVIDQPPYDERAEQCVIGSIMQDNQRHPDVAEVLTGNDFYLRVHRDIFNRITREINSGKPADAVTIGNHPDIDFSYCITLQRNTPSSKNVMAYARTVRKTAIQRSLISAANDIAEQAFAHCENELELVGNAEKRLAEVTDLLTTQTQDNSISAALKDAYEKMRELAESNSSLKGLTSGIPGLDTLTHGFKKGTTTAIAARPGCGKTTFALNIVEIEAIAGGYPLVFSIEMKRDQLANKMIASNGNVKMHGIMSPKSLNDVQWKGVAEGIKRLEATNLEIVDNGSITTDMIRIECRRYLGKHGKLTLIVVDYVQIVRGKKADNRTNQVAEISRDLTALAKEFDCPLIVLSQLSRDIEKEGLRTPKNSDLRESGQLEQDAEDIIFIHNENDPDKPNVNDGLAKLIVSKSRNGQRGSVVVEFDGAYSRFKNTSRTWSYHKQKPYTPKFKG